MMNKMKRVFALLLLVVLSLGVLSATAFAAPADATDQSSAVATEETQEADSTGAKAIAAGISIGLAALGGAVAMGIAIAKTSEGIARQPEAEGKLRTTLMLGLVFIETAIIYALIIAILIIFVL